MLRDGVAGDDDEVDALGLEDGGGAIGGAARQVQIGQVRDAHAVERRRQRRRRQLVARDDQRVRFEDGVGEEDAAGQRGGALEELPPIHDSDRTMSTPMAPTVQSKRIANETRST